jgi:transketolase
MTVLAPADAWELRSLFGAAFDLTGPCYMRIGKKGEPTIYDAKPTVEIGRAVKLRDGDDIAIIATGTLVVESLAAANHISSKGVSASVYSMHTIKPLDERLLGEVFNRFRLVVTIEEHSLIGGLGGAVAEWQSDHGAAKGRLVRIGTPDKILHHTGEQEEARKLCRLEAEQLAERILAEWNQLTT